jgi:hypothetical protein
MGSVVLGLAPAGLAAAWIPVRDQLPNTDVALLLVLSVAAVATLGGRTSALIGSLAAVTGFDFFDTAPYGQLLITGTRDVVTAAVLFAASLLVAQLAVSLENWRRVAARRGEDFTVMASAARLVSVGEAAGMVVTALAGELVSRLDLLDCEFRYGLPGGDRPYIARDGSIIAVVGGDTDHGLAELDLPVWTGDEMRGYYRMTLGSPTTPPRHRLLAAVGIGEQAGAALAGQLVDPLPGPRPRRLRLVR